MTEGKEISGGFDDSTLAAYLTGVLGEPVEVRAVRPLGSTHGDDRDPKGLGYGTPLEVECLVAGAPRQLVLSRTRPTQGFGHDYPADRAWQALYGHAAYNGFPRHVRSLDVGFARAAGALVSAADAVEFFQIVEKAPGRLYRLDLERLLDEPLTPLDVARTEALARFLAEAHAVKRDEPTLYVRRIRELVGHGECLMGILDSYPHPYAPLPPATCEAIERAMVRWRWRLRTRTSRLARVHGDFHPWNLLFAEGTDFAILDRSRGEWGEPADDISALAINYLFFGMRRGASKDAAVVAPPFDRLFARFLETYLETSGDQEILEVLPPFFAFRALVIANPRWYPSLTETTRAALVAFARRMAEGSTFDPSRVPELVRLP
jgi:aminoglycoside phosphotransferase (APT) family kinase protein